jgi:hypothetical protein
MHNVIQYEQCNSFEIISPCRKASREQMGKNLQHTREQCTNISTYTILSQYDVFIKKILPYIPTMFLNVSRIRN